MNALQVFKLLPAFVSTIMDVLQPSQIFCSIMKYRSRGKELPYSYPLKDEKLLSGGNSKNLPSLFRGREGMGS